MKTYKAGTFVALLSTVLLLFHFERAEAIPVEMGDILRVDFDLSSMSPAAPYDRLSFRMFFDSTDILDAGEGFSWAVYDTEGGLILDQLVDFVATSSLSSPTFNANLSPVLSDGIGFVLFTDIVGSFELNAVGVFGGVIGAGSTPTVGGQLTVIHSVPEPSALALLGIGLAGLAWLRRRQT